MSFKKYSNEQLLVEAKDRVTRETAATLEVLHLLLEIEKRRAFADRSYPSLFEFCVNFLGYKRGAAYRRILAMRALKEFPEIEEKVGDGSLALMTIAQAQGYFKAKERKNTPLPRDQKKKILKELENKTARETEAFFLKIQPNISKPESLKEIDNENFEWTTKLPGKTRQKLDQFRLLLGREGNHLENIDVIDRALGIAIERVQEKERKIPTLGKMNILWRRDQGQCTFVDPLTKERCAQKTRLEIDHIQPRALGGDSSLENLRLLCKAHNQRAAIRVFGLNQMEKYF